MGHGHWVPNRVSNPYCPPWPVRSALSVAVLAGRQEVVECLVEAGACTPNGTARKAGGTASSTAVHIGQAHPALRAVALAAQLGRVDAVRLLYLRVVAALQGEALQGRRGKSGHPPSVLCLLPYLWRLAPQLAAATHYPQGATPRRWVRCAATNTATRWPRRQGGGTRTWWSCCWGWGRL